MILIYFLLILIIFYFVLLFRGTENKMLNILVLAYTLIGFYFILVIDEINTYLMFIIWGCGLSQLERIEKFLRRKK